MTQRTYQGLFVGGPCAGKRFEHIAPQVNTLRRHPMGPVTIDPLMREMYTKEITAEFFTYEYEMIRTRNGEFGLWRPQNWTLDDTLAELFNGYCAANATWPTKYLGD